MAKATKKKTRTTRSSRSPKKFQSIGVIGKEKGTAAAQLGTKLVKWLEERKYEVHLDSVFHAKVKAGVSHPKSDVPAHCDLLIVLGGDGTLLSAARVVGDKGLPILGVNVGTVGFLTEVPGDDLFDVLPAILQGKCVTEQRDMLVASVHRRGERIADYTALNDAVIHRGALARIIELEIKLDNEYVTTFRADGLIVATPTGSTAYSLAAGGPIVHPTLPTLILTPVSPFTLDQRPLMIPNNGLISATLKTESGEVYLSMDGQVGFSLVAGDVVEVRRAKQAVVLVKPESYSYYEVLRNRLDWGGGQATGA